MEISPAGIQTSQRCVETDEQAVSAAVLIAHIHRGRDLEKCLKGRKYLLKVFRKDATISRQDTLVGPT